MTLEEVGKAVMLYINAGKRGQPMPTPLEGREQVCIDAYKMGQMYAELERVKSC